MEINTWTRAACEGWWRWFSSPQNGFEAQDRTYRGVVLIPQYNQWGLQEMNENRKDL